MAQLTQLPDDVDLSFVSGDTFRIRVRVIDPAEGDPLPLSGYTFCADIEQQGGGKISSFEIEPDPAAPTSAVILTLPPSETAALMGALGATDVFNGFWDLEVTFPPAEGQTLGDVRTVAKGSVTCYDDISQCPPGP